MAAGDNQMVMSPRQTRARQRFTVTAHAECRMVTLDHHLASSGSLRERSSQKIPFYRQLTDSGVENVNLDLMVSIGSVGAVRNTAAKPSIVNGATLRDDSPP